MPELEIPGLRKSAILLITLGKEQATQVMAQMDRDTLERISAEIALLDDISQEEQEAVIEEFYMLGLARQYMDTGGVDYARSVLEGVVGKEQAGDILDIVERSIRSAPFSFLQRTDSDNLLAFIMDEHPQTIALILSHLPSQQASEILGGLPQAKQIEVVRRVANMERTNPEVIREVEEGLEHRLAAIVNQKSEKAGGVESIANVLNLCDRSTEKGILDNLEEDDPDLVEQIRRLMFVFEDILLVNDKGIQRVVKEIETEEMALALKAASDELKEKIFACMSERAVLLIKEEMEYMGPVRLSDVEAAQQKIVDAVRRLEDSGDIIISGRGGEEEIIV